MAVGGDPTNIIRSDSADIALYFGAGELGTFMGMVVASPAGSDLSGQFIDEGNYGHIEQSPPFPGVRGTIESVSGASERWKIAKFTDLTPSTSYTVFEMYVTDFSSPMVGYWKEGPSFTTLAAFPDDAPTSLNGKVETSTHTYQYSLRGGQLLSDKSAQLYIEIAYQCKDTLADPHVGETVTIRVSDKNGTVIGERTSTSSAIHTQMQTLMNEIYQSGKVAYSTVYKFELIVGRETLVTDYVKTWDEPIEPPSFTYSLSLAGTGEQSISGAIFGEEKLQFYIFDKNPREVSDSDMSHIVITSSVYEASPIANPFRYDKESGIKADTDYWVIVFGESLLPPFTNTGKHEWSDYAMTIQQVNSGHIEEEIGFTIEGISIRYMQDFADLSYDDWHKVVDNMIEHKRYLLSDKRDGNNYHIAKMKDGKVWMCDNLRLGDSTLESRTLTSFNTDITEDYDLPESEISDFTFQTGVDKAYVPEDKSKSGYYTCWTPSASSVGKLIDEAPAEATWIDMNVPNTILPKGWTLPAGSPIERKDKPIDEFSTFLEAEGIENSAIGAKKLMGEPYTFTLPGEINSGSLVSEGEKGTYITRTTAGVGGMGPHDVINYSFELTIDTVGVGSEMIYFYYNGYSIRGILKEPVLPGFYSSPTTRAKDIYLNYQGKNTLVRSIYGKVNDTVQLIWGRPFYPAFIETLTYMQDCANYSLTQLKEGMVEEKPYTLIDRRDNTEYTVALLRDGNIWMLDNLRITGKTISSTDSDIIDGLFTIPDSDRSAFNLDVDGQYQTNNDAAYLDSTYGGYYSWHTATAGTSSSVTSSYANASGSICPKGWRLPTGGAINETKGNGEFQKLIDIYGITKVSELVANPLNFTYTGYIYYISGLLHKQGEIGRYWSSTRYTQLSAYCLDFSDSSIRPQYNDKYVEGHAIRGICKGNGS